MAVDKLVDSTQLDADITSVANAIRTKGGTSGSLAFPAGFVSAIGDIETGITPTGTKQISITANGTTTEDVTNYASAEITVDVQGGGVVEPLYELGTYYSTSGYILTRRKNHIKIEWEYGSPRLLLIGLRQFDQTNLPEWFLIPAGSLVEIRYENVVNTNGVMWNANLKEADTNTSLQYGIGNDTHENGAIITVTPTQNQSVGCLFIYLESLSSVQSLEFDVIMTVDGVRYI